MAEKVILELKNIDKCFIGVKALDSISMDVRKGEVHAIVGENGAGKTTLMKILSGAYPSSSYSGEIIIDGKNVSFNNPGQAQAAGIEMIYQEIDLIPDLSVCENVLVGNIRRKNRVLVDWKKMYDDAEKILDKVGLDADVHEKIKNLSTSRQQMVAIAKAVIKKPRLLVLDEPTSSLTENEKEYLFNIINELRNSGLSCIYISHKIEEVMEISDRITVMRDGCKIGTLEKKDFDVDLVIKMMVGRSLENRYPKRNRDIGDEVLKIENLTVMHKYIDGKKIIDSASFVLKKGEILGIAGLVGSGRSELVNAIFGNLDIEAGYSIYVNKNKEKINSIRKAISGGIALLTEDRRASGIIPALSIRENATIVMLNRMFKTGVIKRKEETGIVNELMDKLNIKAPDVETKIKNLSGGNQQKVIMARWLLQQPRIMILDEPTRGIDVGAKYEIYNIINKLTSDGVSFIIISSELPELLGICDRFVVLNNGTIVREFDSDEATEELIMAAATGVV